SVYGRVNISPPETTDGITLSIVLPSYDDAQLLARHVPLLLRYLDGLGVSHEVIISDDGSNDGGRTQRTARELGCRYVCCFSNQGKGAAVRRGMLAATGQYRIFTDADIPYELDTIERFLWYLDFKEFHFVAGDRSLDGSDYFVQIPLGRRLGSHIYSFIVGRFVAGGWFDTQCGMKGFRAGVAEDLFGVGRIR